MQYVRSISGSVSKTWNSINPATLSGAIDVIVVELEDGSLACSPFHVRFGKFSLLRPYEKKVEFRVNNARQDYAMKLGEGGEAFFVFETTADVPESLLTSPLVSPASSPETKPVVLQAGPSIQDLEPLDLAAEIKRPAAPRSATTSNAGVPIPIPTSDRRSQSYTGKTLFSQSNPDSPQAADLADQWATRGHAAISFTAEDTPSRLPPSLQTFQSLPEDPTRGVESSRTGSPPQVVKHEALTRAITLSKKLWSSNIPSTVNDEGDLMLDMTGYKSSEEDSLRAEVVARQILSEELEGNYDIGSLIGADEKGNLWIYSSEEAKEAAARKAAYPMIPPVALMSSDAISDPGYHSDDNQSQQSLDLAGSRGRRESDGAVGLMTPPDSPDPATSVEQSRNYAKTLRLTSDQLKAMGLKPGANPISFTVNRATCQAYIYLWSYSVPIVISDIDGTITKSDVLGHVLNTIGRDWTHLGVAKLYTDIVANGYNILYLTSRSVGQADTTRSYINGILQEGYKLPKGPVIMSPDRTIAALRREVYLRKPEVFKMACLRDIKNLFHQRESPFYAGFGNRLTDALSYRSVNIPSTRIFTINSNAEVSLDLLSLNKYKTGYTSMRETVDHFFPPVGMLVHEGGENFTDFNYWRDTPMDLGDFSASDSDEDTASLHGGRSEDEASDGGDDDILSEDMADSYLSRDSLDGSINNLMQQSIASVTGRHMTGTIDEDTDADSDIGDTADEDANALGVETLASVLNFGSSGVRAGLHELAEALNQVDEKTVV